MSKKKNKARSKAKPAESQKRTAGLNVARRSADTANHWFFARPETPAAAVKPKNRADARTKAREEYLNNPYAAGFADTFALYIIGTGPRLRFVGFEKRLQTKIDERIAWFVEGKWRNWADSVRLAKTLRLGVKSLVVDGEAFFMESLNPKRDIFGINYTVIDPQRIGNPAGRPWSPRQQDGLFFDEFGNVEGFCLYDVPDTDCSYYNPGRYKIVPAENIHFAFKENLPETTRGWSWFAPVLESMGRLRDYEDGVIEAAKSAANTFATIETQNGYLQGGGDSYLTVDPTPYYAWESHAPQRNKVIQLPPETTMKAFQPAQPTTNVPAFISGQVARLGRGMGLTRNRSTGSSHEYNFASGKLDSQPFDMLIKCIQKDLIELDVMDKIFADFYRAILPDLYAAFPDMEIPSLSDAQWEWRWPNPPLVDEEAQSRADAIRIKNYQATIQEVWEERHPDSCFEDVRPTIMQNRADFPELFSGKAGDEAIAVPEMTGTANNEPKADEIKGDDDGDDQNL